MNATHRRSRHVFCSGLLLVLLLPILAACGGTAATETPSESTVPVASADAPASQAAASTAPASEAASQAPASQAAASEAAASEAAASEVAASEAAASEVAASEAAASEAAAASATPSASASAATETGAAPEEGVAGGTMTGAWIGPCCVGVDNLNPMNAGGDHHWLNKIYSHLVTYNVEYTELIGDLAEEWSISDDNLTWTFKLRDGVKWHDGTDFTADDVAFSLEVCLDPDAGGCVQAGQLGVIEGATAFIEKSADTITGIEVVDPLTIAITTASPNAALADTLAETYILQKASLGQVPRAEVGKSDYWTTQAIGTGPFKMVNHQPAEFTELGRFDDYFRGAPLLEKLIRRSFTDPAAALLAFDNGEIDFTYLTADEVERAQGNANATVIPGPSQVDNTITLNPAKNPAFADPRFRQAILHAINREAIIENLYGGAAKPVSCLYGNEQFIPADINPYEYDPAKATALLAEAGIDPASLGEIVMDTYYNDQLSLDVMTAMQQDLAAIGITITIQQMDGPSWTKRYYEDGESQMSFIGGANGADGNRAFQYYHSSALWPKGGNNYKFSNAELDRLLEEGAAEMDASKRPAIYQEACRIMSEELPWVYMWETIRYGYVSNKIGNFLYTPAPGGGSYYDQAEKWFIRP